MAEAPSEGSYTSGFSSMATRYCHRHGQDDDPFANFSYIPPRPTGRFRSFSRRNRYQAQQQTMASMASLHASRERLSGSITNLSSFGRLCSMVKPLHFTEAVRMAGSVQDN